MIDMAMIEKTVNVSLDQFVELIKAKEKLENIKKLLERCDYPVDEVKALLDIGKVVTGSKKEH